MKDIPGAYEPQKYEDKIYESWEKRGFFNPDNLSGEPYSIMMPPPNVTGVLHLGHALENSLMDTMARFERLRGKKVLLLPGTDHAAVATQAKVEKILAGEGIKNPRAELGREKLLEKIREYAEKSKATILSQIRKMGTSCDWSRLAYTFDEPRNRAVNTVFKKMYDDGLIYRGLRAVNWSVLGQSTLSDDEIVYVPRKAKLYTFKYSAGFPFTIATTRPETKLGDTAVAVNPADKRYKKYIGKEFDVDFVGVKLHLKIIADRGVDVKFGTGALGVTSAHSLVDYDMGVKNKLPIIRVIGEDGKIVPEIGGYAGLTVEGAREKVVENLKKAGLLLKEEEIEHNVGTSDRFGDVVEVLPKVQWFLDVNKKIPGRAKSLKQLMKEAVSGKDGVCITPKRFEKIYFNWIDNLRDWCLSRQIWWGHRLPVWYKQEKSKIKDEEIYIGEEPPKGDGWAQDSDTLDTWFSSGLWTFSTLGWPENPKNKKTQKHKNTKTRNDLEAFHPTSWMQMGYEILFFWMARMVLMSEYALGEKPFNDVYIHGILRDENGKKFSKSAGNAVDPLEISAKYGTDALRLSLMLGVSPGQDQKFYIEKVEGSRNLVNKIWNVSRFIVTSGDKKQEIINKEKTLADEWISVKFNNLIAEVTKHIENYEFSSAGEKLRDFTWSDLADWYLEISKVRCQNSKLLLEILEKLLIMWHPFIPFVTEALWGDMLGKKDLIVAPWPKPAVSSKPSAVSLKNFEKIRAVVTKIRNLRAEWKVEPGKKVHVILVAKSAGKLLESEREIIKGLGRVENLEIKSAGEKPEGFAGAAESGIGIYLDLSGAVDVAKEKARIGAELMDKEKYLTGLSEKLKNKDFVSRAPKTVVDGEREKLAKAEEEAKNLKEQLNQLR